MSKVKSVMIKIRGYQRADYPHVKAILQESDMFDDVWDAESQYWSMIRVDPDAILVALIGDKVVGNIIISWYGGELARLYRLAVVKKYRSQGIGSKLLTRAEEIVKKRGGKELGFYVDINKKELQGHYARRGYQTSGKKFIYTWKLLD